MDPIGSVVSRLLDTNKQTNKEPNKPNMLIYFTCRSWAATAVPSLNKPGRDKQINK